MADFTAALRQRQLILMRDAQPVLDLALDQGGCHRLVASDVTSLEAAVAALEAVPGVAVLPAEGGLLGAMTVSANLSLALRYGQEVDAATLREWDHQLALAFRLCGVDARRLQTLGRELPMRLERLERWLVGFVLRIMRPSELLVLDRAFAGLSRRQAEAVLALEAAYHQFHPFRPTLFVDLDAHELPALPQCRLTVELGVHAPEVEACPS